MQLRAIEAITSLECLCVYNQSAYADNCADAVDQLLIVDVLYNVNTKCTWKSELTFVGRPPFPVS